MSEHDQASVLIIDDDAIDRESVYRLIDADFKLSSAGSGQVGIELARRTIPDCILLDLRLPDVDGLQLIPEFVVHGIPVVVMTRVGSESIAVEAMKAGAQDYVRKDQMTHPLICKSIRQAIEAVAMQRKILAQQDELANFVSVAAHDLRAPLRHITKFAELAQEECAGKVSADVDHYLDRVVSGGTRMANLLESLVRFARGGRNKEVLEPVCLNSVVEQALSNLSVEVDNSNAKISVTTLPTVLGHEPSLVELLQNLIGNAIKYSGDSAPCITLSASNDGGDLTVHVRDNGIGIPAEFQAKVFQPFHRLHSYSQIEGSGIGLANCKRILEHHGGTISVASTPGEGSTFSFTLRPAETVPSSSGDDSQIDFAGGLIPSSSKAPPA